MTNLNIIENTTVSLPSSQKVIKQKDYSAIISIQEAKQRAELDIQAQFEKNVTICEELKKEAYNEGYQQALTSLFTHLMHYSDTKKSETEDSMKKLIPLAILAAKKIVGKQLDLHPDTIVNIVLGVLKQVSQNRQVVVYVSPQDKEVVDANKEQFKEVFERLEMLSLKTSEDVSPGGCIIETEAGIINANLDNLWEALEKSLLRYSDKPKVEPKQEECN